MFCHIAYHSINRGWFLPFIWEDLSITKYSDGTNIYITTKNSRYCYPEGQENPNIKEKNKIKFDSLDECKEFLEKIN